LCKSTSPAFTSSYKKNCGDGDSFLISTFHFIKVVCILINKKIFISLAAAGNAVDRLEGDSKKDSCFAWPLLRSVDVFRTAAIKKIIALAMLA